MIIKIISRKSKLAMWQTNMVADTLKENGVDTEIFTMKTIGDKVLDVSIAKIGSKGVFTEELEGSLEAGDADIAVHSAKDMPSTLPEGFELITFTDREQMNDVLVSRDKNIDINDTSKELIVGTSSVRRKALMTHFYPHVKTVEMRGNLQTRIAKMDDGACDALMLAYAGVKRMEYDDMIVKKFSLSEMIPPVGQGSVAIEASANLSAEKKAAIRKCLNHKNTESCLLAERGFLRVLEGGCSIPAFALATLDGDQLTLTTGLSNLDGSEIIRKSVTGNKEDAESIGAEAGNYILNNGGKEILESIKSNS